ncbi:MAG: gamma-glutamyltransferase [Rubritepida sp.]|nr:gamma-glutamyltransferase [Rubritepida sp.]
MSDWRARAGSPFTPSKQAATGTRGMVVTNHPAASAAGLLMLAEGGTAADAAVAALLALSVVEPMMVGPFGGGLLHVAAPDGAHEVLDGMASAPMAARDDMFAGHDPRRQTVGALSVCVPANLLAWEAALARHGRFTLAEVAEPAIRLAARGFEASRYLHECTAEVAGDLARDGAIARLFLPGGAPLAPGARVVNGALAETLRAVAREGAAALHQGDLGTACVYDLARKGGMLTTDDLAAVRMIPRAPVRGTYRGVEVIGPPPPSAGGVHVLQMLNFVEGFDVAAMGFGTAESLHLLAEALKMAFADRAVATADPAFVPVPVARLVAKDYAAERRVLFDPAAARAWASGLAPGRESANTTHVTVVDAEGRIVCATHTINSLFGARILLPETGLIPNNYMALFDPEPDRAQSVAPGKRVTTSMSPLILRRGGAPLAALGLPGGLRIFASTFQAVLNLLDHGMSLQEAVEAPRLWTMGGPVEAETGFAEAALAGLAALGHPVQRVPHVAGGMCAIAFQPDGILEGAACWRADGHPAALAGGWARAGVRFWPEGGRGTA